MDPRGFKREPRTGEQQFGGRRYENFACRRDARNPRGFVDRKASNIIADQFDLAGVNSRADGDSKVVDRGTDRLRAADRPSRPVEHGNEAVACGHDLAAAKPI